MRRPDKSAGKRQRPKTLKRRNAPKVVRHRGSTADLSKKVALFKRERDEALHQQAATAEILRLISSSPSDAQPVFEAIVRSGLKLFPDAAILIVLPDGDKLRAAAFADTDPARAKALLRVWPVPLTREYNHAIAILDRRMIDIPDARDAPSELAAGAQYFLTTGYRAITIMPMMRGGDAIGALSVVRAAPGALSEKQIAVLKTFANQAIIAIENTRLLNELRQRTDDLSESLEQQTATSEVLKVISSSPGELKPVFDALLANAVRICDAKFGVLFLTEGDVFRYVALHGAPPAFAEARRREPVTRVKPGTTIGRVAATKKPAQTADIRAEPAYTSDPERYPILELAGARTILGVPMLKESQLVGAIVIYRQEVRTFTDKQIDLLSNFAAQAVIAIENTRLLNELRESLQQQTATADVLKVISRSTFDLQVVLTMLVESAVQLCEAERGTVFRREGETYKSVAYCNYSPEFKAFHESHPITPGRGTTVGRTALEGKTVQIVDILADPEYTFGRGAKTRRRQGYPRSAPAAGGDSNWCVSTSTHRVAAIHRKQIELVETFADQAVIAIENARLLNELRESLEQQTATSEVLKVISSSQGDLDPVFQAMLENAVRICDASFGMLFRIKDGL